VRSDCDLCEVHVADDLDGQPVEAAGQRWAVLDGNVFESLGPGNESWAEFVVRASRRLLRLGTDHPDETVVVAGHGGIVDASFRALGGLAIQHRINVDVENTAVTEWVTTPGGWRLARYNDAAHLADA
jgi:broad specificity phosphatase PhoE